MSFCFRLKMIMWEEGDGDDCTSLNLLQEQLALSQDEFTEMFSSIQLIPSIPWTEVSFALSIAQSADAIMRFSSGSKSPMSFRRDLSSKETRARKTETDVREQTILGMKEKV